METAAAFLTSQSTTLLVNKVVHLQVTAGPNDSDEDCAMVDDIAMPESPRMKETTQQIETLSLSERKNDESEGKRVQLHHSDEDNNDAHARRAMMDEVIKEEAEVFVNRKSAQERELLREKRKNQISSYRHRELRDARSRRRNNRELQRNGGPGASLSSSSTNTANATACSSSSSSSTSSRDNGNGVDKNTKRRRKKVRFAV